jgi:hypothetical protein
MKEQLLSALHGYQRANEYMESERMAKLAQMTPEQARTIFNDLIEGWEHVATKEKGVERLDQWRVETHIFVRRAFKRLAEAKGLI